MHLAGGTPLLAVGESNQGSGGGGVAGRPRQPDADFRFTQLIVIKPGGSAVLGYREVGTPIAIIVRYSGAALFAVNGESAVASGKRTELTTAITQQKEAA